MKENSVTKSDKTVSDVECGWYSKEDMLKLLKWPASLVDKRRIVGRSQCGYMWIQYNRLCTNHWKHQSVTRKKVEGAIRCCSQDPANLVRCDADASSIYHTCMYLMQTNIDLILKLLEHRQGMQIWFRG